MKSKLIGGILFHRLEIAEKVIHEAMKQNIKVLGIETFTVEGLSVKPYMVYTFDSPNISDCKILGQMNLDFLSGFKDKDFWFEVDLEDEDGLIELNDDRNYINLISGKPGGVYRYKNE